MIAELAMLIEFVHTTTVIAQGPVKALRLPRQRMHELMEEDPTLAQHFSSCIITRLKLLARDVKAVDTFEMKARSPHSHRKRAPVCLRTCTPAERAQPAD